MWTEVTTLGDLLVRAAHRQPARDALVMPGRTATYRQLLEGAYRVARGLVGLGVKRQQHVGIRMHNGLEIVEALFGIALAGAVAVPLHARHKGLELRYVIENADLVVVLTSTADSAHVDFGQVLLDALPSAATQTGALQLPEAPALRHLVDLAGAPSSSAFLSREGFFAAAEPVTAAEIDTRRGYVRIRETALLLYTSGTTASPKGCMLSHEAIVRGPLERATHRVRTGEHDVHYAAGPLYHIATLAALVGSVGAAGTFLCDTFFEPGRAIAMLAERHATVAFPWFSAIVQAILDHPTFDATKLASLRHLFIIAAPSLVRRTAAALPGCEMIQGCGMTEAAGIFALNLPEDDAETRATTQGKPWRDVEMRVRNLEGDGDAPVDAVGELLLRGPCMMDGYWRDPVKTASTIDADGWIHTGDLYSKDARGNYVFNGRLKDMLKVGGENVAVVEIESLLCEHPAVKLAEVVGKADPRLDEVPVAFVELRPGSAVTAEELIAFCQPRVARYKVPREIVFLAGDAWPMSATKVDKVALRQRINQRQC